jgi:DNA-binding CsgD family transcriptional regulator
MTQKKQMVLKYIMKGLSNEEIAKEMEISSTSVKWHLTEIYKIQNVKSRAQLMSKMAEVPDVGGLIFKYETAIGELMKQNKALKRQIEDLKSPKFNLPIGRSS